MRLWLPVAHADTACPLCDAVNDRVADHARSCPFKRPHKAAQQAPVSPGCQSPAAGLNPEVEKAGLLPPRPDEAGAPEDGQRNAGLRRPADVGWELVHGAAAFDLAVTAGSSTAAMKGNGLISTQPRSARLLASSSCPWLPRALAGAGAPQP